MDFSENLNNFIEEIGTLIPVFEPDRPFRLIFDLLMLIYLIAVIADIILKFGFELTENNYHPTLWIVLEVMPCWLFLLEALLDVNTAYYSKGNNVANRRQILKNYAQNSLIVDILTICPFFFREIEGGKFLEMLVVLRLKNVENILKRLEEYMQWKGKKEGLFQLIKLIISLLFLAHICACAWHYIGLQEQHQGITNNWLVAKGIDTKKWYIRYPPPFFKHYSIFLFNFSIDTYILFIFQLSL